MRRRCANFARCGKTGHYYDPAQDGWVRCTCLKMEMNRRALGDLWCENPLLNTDLLKSTRTDLIIEGTLPTVRQHCAGAVLGLTDDKRTWEVVYSQRLADIWLSKDDDLRTTARLGWSVSLLILFLGWGELPNKRLPECIKEVLDRRALAQVPTWIHMNCDFNQIAHKYSEELARRLSAFERVDLD